jgi:hypothetical protein
MSSKQQKIRQSISKLGWVSFAGYTVTSLCGIDKVARVASVLTVTCAIVVNGMKAVEDIQDIVTT